MRGTSANAFDQQEEEEDPDIKEDLDTFKQWLANQAKPDKPAQAQPTLPACAPKSCNKCSKDPCNLAEYQIQGFVGM